MYVGFTASANDCYQAKETLKANGIPFTLLAYHDDAQHASVFASLNSWTYGDGELRTFTDFPVIHWKEFYSDWTTKIRCASGLTELVNSTLLANKNLVTGHSYFPAQK